MTTVRASEPGMAAKDSRGPGPAECGLRNTAHMTGNAAHTPEGVAASASSVISLPPVPRLFVALVAVVALAAAIAGALVGANEGDEGDEGPARAARPARPALPERVMALARRLPLERQVGQLFLLGVPNGDTAAARRLHPGGIVLEGGVAAGLARRERPVPPWVLAVQDGPAPVPADIPSVRAARADAVEAARAIRDQGVKGVLGPVVDVGFESGSALGTRIYSDDPGLVAHYAEAVIRVYRAARLFSAAKHFPGLGAADQPTTAGPANVGLELPQLRERDLIPFRAAIEAGVPGVVLSHALYPVNDFTRPASLSPAFATDLLRDELGFAGVAITDDLADPAITPWYSVPAAAVEALQAGVDMLWISGPPSDQEAAYRAVLRSVRRGAIPRERLQEALLRVLEVKHDYGLIR
jgi:beta-N-acetylhexosaminidase